MASWRGVFRLILTLYGQSLEFLTMPSIETQGWAAGAYPLRSGQYYLYPQEFSCNVGLCFTSSKRFIWQTRSPEFLAYRIIAADTLVESLQDSMSVAMAWPTSPRSEIEPVMSQELSCYGTRKHEHSKPYVIRYHYNTVGSHHSHDLSFTSE